MARGPRRSSRLHIHQSSPRASREPSWAFIYNLLTTEWKLIEPAGSKCLPVCQQQMPLLPGQELFNSSWLRDSQGDSPSRFWLCHLYQNALPLPLAELLPIPSSENGPGPAEFHIYCTHIYLYCTDTAPSASCSARCQHRACLNN